MMLVRSFGTVIAMTFTSACVLGICALIASDFVDLKRLSSWVLELQSRSAETNEPEILKNADNITFFKSIPVNGTKLKVTTGVDFASAKDLRLGKTSSRWCYINSNGGVYSKKISLGSQFGNGKPVYVDTSKFTRKQLAEFGMSAERLTRLARTHCRLNGFDPEAKARRDHSSTSPNKPPIRLWNWKSPETIKRGKRIERSA